MTVAATADRRQRLRDRLLDEAERTIAANGLPELRARSLAEAAGCSVGAIYTAFADLDTLVLEVNGRTLAAIDAALQPSAPPGDPQSALLHLADAYLAYAAAEKRRWEALFLHRLPEDTTAPAWYAEQEAQAFSHIEAPLAVLRPDMAAADRAILARTLFSAVHGVVALGLDEKVASLGIPELRSQLRQLVSAITVGLSAGR